MAPVRCRCSTKPSAAVLEDAARRWGDRPALIVRHQNIRWTYRELNEAAERFAAGLLKLGLQPGDRVGIWSPNRYEWVLTQFATAKAGLILVNVNPAYRISELEFALNKVGCQALMLAPNFKSSDYVGMLRATWRRSWRRARWAICRRRACRRCAR